MSFGVAELQGYEEGTALVTRTDIALYASKKGGRNCVYKHDGNTVHLVAPVKKAPAPEIEKAQQHEQRTDPPVKNEKPEATPEAEEPAPKPAPEPDLADAVKLEVVTDLPTRTNFCQQVRNRTAEWKRGGATFSVLLIEANHSERGGNPDRLSLSASRPR